MNTIKLSLQHASEHCQEQGVRLTDKRKHILSALLQSPKALSAYEIVDYCKQKMGANMPAMSVYRILDFLQQQQLVHKLQLANKYIACAHICCDHKHQVSQFLICAQCEQVEEISIKKSLLASIKDNVDNAGYQLLSPQLELNCLCNSCAIKLA